jgi:hypothetical protein
MLRKVSACMLCFSTAGPSAKQRQHNGPAGAVVGTIKGVWLLYSFLIITAGRIPLEVKASNSQHPEILPELHSSSRNLVGYTSSKPSCTGSPSAVLQVAATQGMLRYCSAGSVLERFPCFALPAAVLLAGT